MRTSKILLAAGLATVSAVTLAACTGGSTPTPVNTDATVNLGLVLAPTDLDIRTTAGAALNQALLDNVYQGLVTIDDSGKIVRDIAKSYTISPDGLTYDFTLNSGVTFSDGHALTADDVVSSLQDATKNKTTYVDASGLADVASVTAPDVGTVEVKLDKPNIETLWALAGRAGIVLEKGATNDLKTTALGTGPYTVAGFQANTSLTLDRNDNYWGTKAQVKEIVFHYYADTATAANAALSGDLQALLPVDPTQKAKFTGNQNLAIVQGNSTDKWTLGFNNTDPTLSKKDVRTAIREAIDPKAIIAAVGGAGLPLGGPIPTGDPGYQDLTSVDAYNAADAKAKFAAAGVTRLTLTIPTPYGTTISDILTSELNAVGVKLTVKQVDFNTWLSQVFIAGNYQLSIVDHVESHDFGTLWTNPKYYFHYDNAQVQSRYHQALASTTEGDEAKYLSQAAAIVSNDAAAEWLYQGVVLNVVSTSLKGLPVNNTNNRLNLANISVLGGQ